MHWRYEINISTLSLVFPIVLWYVFVARWTKITYHCNDTFFDTTQPLKCITYQLIKNKSNIYAQSSENCARQNNSYANNSNVANSKSSIGNNNKKGPTNTRQAKQCAFIDLYWTCMYHTCASIKHALICMEQSDTFEENGRTFWIANEWDQHKTYAEHKFITHTGRTLWTTKCPNKYYFLFFNLCVKTNYGFIFRFCPPKISDFHTSLCHSIHETQHIGCYNVSTYISIQCF